MHIQAFNIETVYTQTHTHTHTHTQRMNKVKELREID